MNQWPFDPREAISGAHFNPAVTLVFLARGAVDSKTAATFIAVQIIAVQLVGAFLAFLSSDNSMRLTGQTSEGRLPFVQVHPCSFLPNSDNALGSSPILRLAGWHCL